MSRRLTLLLTAVVIAAAGTALVFLYVKNADDRALADQRPVRVLVAKNTIPAGTSMREAAQGSLEPKTVALSSAVDEPLSSIAQYEDQVTLTTIIRGQQLSANMLGKEPLTTAALPIEDGDIAVTYQFTDPGRVAGFVQPGSRVVVFATIQGSGRDNETRVLLSDAQVLAVGPSTAVSGQEESGSTNAEELPRALVTLSLSTEEAARLVYGSDNGTLYLGLRNDDSDVTTGTVVSQNNLFG